MTVRAEPADGDLRFAVTDTGRGIPREHQERIFERFYQVPGTEDRGRAGLGLAIARDIVQSHGGEIHLESAGGPRHDVLVHPARGAAARRHERTLAVLLLLCRLGRPRRRKSPIATDRPGFLFSSLTVGRGVVQAELGLPSVTLDESDDVEVRSTSLVGLLRFGVSDDFELRLGAPIYNEVRVEPSASDRQRLRRPRGRGQVAPPRQRRRRGRPSP